MDRLGVWFGGHHTGPGRKTDVPTFAGVRYEGVYRGIDWVFHASQKNTLEYDFNIAPETNPKTIAMEFAGAPSKAGAEQLVYSTFLGGSKSDRVETNFSPTRETPTMMPISP